MYAESAQSRRVRSIPILFGLFFLSGATGLVYENLWARSLHLVFGTTHFAIATVLAAFMAGLALGGAWMAGRADQVRSPLKVYALLEVGIGLYALAFPKLLLAVKPLYVGFHHAVDPGPWLFGVFQFFLVGLLLVLPTTLMGATLPLLSRFVSTRVDDVGNRVGLLYGTNTLGAVVGVWASGFVLLPSLGLSATNRLAAGANLALGVAAFALSVFSKEGDAPPEVQPSEIAGEERLPSQVLVLMAIAALTGLAALVYELAWFRLMSLILGGSTYAFSTMLLAFLIGIALGGTLGGRPADRLLKGGGPRRLLLGLAIVQAGIALGTTLCMWIYPELPFFLVDLYRENTADHGLGWSRQIWLAVMVMTLPALLMGASFPLLVRAVVGRNTRTLGRPVGRIYAANTLGSLIGAILAGFFLLPAVHVVGTVTVGAAANLVAANLAIGLAYRGSPSFRRITASSVGATLVGLLLLSRFPPPWDPLLMTAGTYKYVSEMSDRSRAGVRAYAIDDYELLYYDEGVTTVVTVAQSIESGNIWLANNGKVEASTTVDMATQVLISHLPFLFQDEFERTALVGLASGITAGALTLHPEVGSLEIIEIEPSIVEASHYFDEYNHQPLEDPRVRLVLNDARNYLDLLDPGTYDLFICQPSNPWLAGVSNLFTREFFALGKSRLKDGGIWSQWIQLYGMDYQDLQALLAAFLESFPHTVIFSTIDDADVVLLGSDSPLPLDIVRAQGLFENAQVREQLADVEIEDGYALLTRFLLSAEDLEEIVEGVTPNSDDNMRVEFNAPRQVHEWTAHENHLALLRAADVPEMSSQEETLELGKAYLARENWVNAMVSFKRVLEETPGHEIAAPLLREARRHFERKVEE